MLENTARAVDAARQIGRRFTGADWYLFGSSARGHKCAGDIDLLIVHDEAVYGASFRKELATLCMSLPIHLTILTRAEERELSFIARAGGCHKFYPG